MFQHISYIRKQSDPLRCHFIINDTCFSQLCEINLNENTTTFSVSTLKPIAVIETYYNRKLPIIPNVIKYYQNSYYDPKSSIMKHADIIDKYFPAIGFKKHLIKPILNSL